MAPVRLVRGAEKNSPPGTLKRKGIGMIKTSVKHCGYGFIEETANDLLKHMNANEHFVDLKITSLSDIMAIVMLIYESEV